MKKKEEERRRKKKEEENQALLNFFGPFDPETMTWRREWSHFYLFLFRIERKKA